MLYCIADSSGDEVMETGTPGTRRILGLVHLAWVDNCCAVVTGEGKSVAVVICVYDLNMRD